MAGLRILKYPHPALRAENEEIEVFDDDVKKLAKDMFKVRPWNGRRFDVCGLGCCAGCPGRPGARRWKSGGGGGVAVFGGWPDGDTF